MFFDWKAATERHNDGNIFNSINKINKDRFKMSEQLVAILNNTALRMEYKPKAILKIGSENIIWTETDSLIEGRVDGVIYFILQEKEEGVNIFKSKTKEYQPAPNLETAKQFCELSLFDNYHFNE